MPLSKRKGCGALPVLPRIFVESPILVEQVDEGQVQSFPDCVIVLVVGGSDLQRTRAKLPLHILKNNGKIEKIMKKNQKN